MSFEQIEAQLTEFEDELVGVIVPIRGTIIQVFYGKLSYTNDADSHAIIFRLTFYPDAELNFQAHDVDKILNKPNDMLAASIILKADAWMEQSKVSHA